MPARLLRISLLLFCLMGGAAALTVENSADDTILEDSIEAPLAPITVSGTTTAKVWVSLSMPTFANAELSCANLPAGVQIYTSGVTGWDSLTEFYGPPADVNAALASLRLTAFADFHGLSWIRIAANQGTEEVQARKWITIQSVEDPPELLGLGYHWDNEDAFYVGFDDFYVDDADGDPLTLTWTIPASALAGVEIWGVHEGVIYTPPAPGGDGNVTLSLSGTPDAINGVLDRWILFHPALNFNGFVSYSVRVTDGKATVDMAATLYIAAVNDAPIITGQLPVATAFGQSRNLLRTDLLVTDPDSNYPAGFSLSAGDGSGYTRSGNTITPLPGFVGTLSIPVKVRDGFLDSNLFTLLLTVNPDPAAVMASGRLNSGPGGTRVLRYLGNPGQSYTIQFSADLASWQTLVRVTADAQGQIRSEDHPPSDTTQRYYRLLLP